jgi:hypothetical protein
MRPNGKYSKGNKCVGTFNSYSLHTEEVLQRSISYCFARLDPDLLKLQCANDGGGPSGTDRSTPAQHYSAVAHAWFRKGCDVSDASVGRVSPVSAKCEGRLKICLAF